MGSASKNHGSHRVVVSYASTPGVRSRMRQQRSRDTAPELAVRRLLHAAGLRYRVDRRPLPGLRRRADIVFGPAQVAVFIDGCFWHGCPTHGRRPVANDWYWPEKIRRNRERDADTTQQLEAAGWLVIRAWEHESAQAVADRVVAAVDSRRPSAQRFRARASLSRPGGPRPVVRGTPPTVVPLAGAAGTPAPPRSEAALAVRCQGC